MVSYAKALFYGVFFLFVTVAIHEVGHLIVARRLISESATVHFFPSFPFGSKLGFVEIPGAHTKELWKVLGVALAGPALATILMFIIWLNTKNAAVAVIASFFSIHQLVYSFIEPLGYLQEIPVQATMLPLFIAGGWVLPYAYHVSNNPEDWEQ